MCEEKNPAIREREYRKALRARYISEHKCVDCGMPLPEGWELKACARCKAIQVKTGAERMRRMKQKRIEAGLCPCCGKRPPTPARKTCEVCREKKSAYDKERLAKRKK